MGNRLQSNVDDREGGSGFSGPNYKQVVLNQGNSLMRIVDPESFVRFYEVWPIGDDGKPHRFTVAIEFARGEEIERDFNILCEMAGDPYPRQWFKGGLFESIKDPVTNGQKFVWEERAPEAFLIMKGNDKNSFKPKLKFAWNCIPRFGEMDENNDYHMYCEENKKTQVLVAGQMVLNELSKISQNNGELDTYDVVINRTGEGRDTKYTVNKAEKDKFAKTVIGGLSADEKAYERWDLVEELKVSSPQEIYDALKETIAKIDASAGTDYLARLQRQIGNTETVSTRTAAPVAATPAATPAQPAPVAQRAVAPAPVTQRAVAPAATKHVCNSCKTPVADDAENCPKCGTMVGGPCQECGKVFSIYDTVCPHCGKEYPTVQA